jgi:hypothetical protein
MALLQPPCIAPRHCADFCAPSPAVLRAIIKVAGKRAYQNLIPLPGSRSGS